MVPTVRPLGKLDIHWRWGYWPAALILAVILCTSSVAVASAQRTPVVEVKSSSQDVVSFGCDKLVHRWTATTQGIQPRERFALEVPGFVSAGSPGSPSVPRKGGWVVIPPGKSARLSIVQETWVNARGRSLAVVPVPVRVGDPATDDASFSGVSILPDEELPLDLPYPPSVLDAFASRKQGRSGPAVQLGETTWWRGHRIVSYSIVPVRYDNAARATEVLESGAWEIRFVEDRAVLNSPLPAHHAQKTTNRFDDQFGSGFLNANLLSTLVTESVGQGPGKFFKTAPAQFEKIRGQKSGTLKGAEVQIPVSSTRMFKVAHSTLSSNDLLPAGITLQESDVRLYQRRYLTELDDGSGQAPYAEIEVPIRMVGNGGTFDGDDFFIFYGLRSRDDEEYTMVIDGQTITIPGSGDPYEAKDDANIYWLAFSTPDVDENWARMETIELPAASSAPLASYSRTEHQEEAVVYRGSVPYTTSDRIINNNWWDNNTNITIAPLYSPDPAGSNAEFKISVAGFVAENLDVAFSLDTGSLDTVELGVFRTTTRNEVYFFTDVPISAIDGASTKVTMRAVGTHPFMRVYLNYVELTYDALYQATNNHLQFSGTEYSGSQPMVVSGFENDSMGLIEITNPRRPVIIDLKAANLVADGEYTSLSIEPEQSGEQRIFYAHGDMLGNGIPNFAYWLTDVVDTPVDPTMITGDDPALVVITHEEFWDGIDPWIAHRKARSGGDLAVHKVKVQDIFNWYSGGMHDAWAIKRFIAHAISQWGTYALQIVGDANENMRELGVNSSGRPFATDWVPTHYHNQSNTGYATELLGSDKWYATFEIGEDYPFDNFPDFVRGPWEMLVGRFPCNSNEELANIIGKIVAVESPQPNQTWRKRGIFFADDSWSNGWGAAAFSTLTYKPNEEYFATSARDSLGPWWGSGTGVTMVPDTLDLATWLDPHWTDDPYADRPSDVFKNYTMDEAYPPLLSSLNAGGLVAHFQGHGSGYVLTSEYWFRDQIAGAGVVNVADLNNVNRPWVFFGMGCHIADWCRNTVVIGDLYKEPSLSEKFMVNGASGASASYASSGYEYISTNLRYGEMLFKDWTLSPPVSRGAGGLMNNRSRWVLGELLWSGEAEIMSILAYDTHFREAVAQFTLLGDPLMVLDGGEPEVTATLHGTADEDIAGTVELVALDSSNKRLITVLANDEAGIDRLEIMDSDGNDLSASIVSEALPRGAQSHQEVIYELEIDVLPYEHEITVKVYDTGAALPGDRHYELQLEIKQESEFTSSGEIVDPATFIFRAEEPVDFNGLISSSAWLNEEMDIGLTGEHLILTNEVFAFNRSNELAFSFTAEENGETDEDRAVVLSIDGHDTRYVLSAGAGGLIAPAITGVYTFPNPLHDSTRFVYESSSAGGSGRVRIFSMAGQQIAQVDFTDLGNEGGGIIPWDGRDAEGDELGNGTYLYRLELETSSGQLVSQMQRLVIMR